MVTYNKTQTNIYYHMSTKNRSFLDVHKYLKDIGISNNKFMLVLLDPDLARIDPFDPALTQMYKVKVLRECINNPWYFLREIVRIPDAGGHGTMFQLHRGNLALLFLVMMNINIYVELPRQTGKTIAAVTWYLYLYLFGTRSTEISFLNKKFDDSKDNLDRLKKIKDMLPSYLKMDVVYASNGSKLKARENVETMQHPINLNRIRTVPSARNKTSATSLMRGRTTPLIYLDEYAFMPYNNIVYTNMVPAFHTAAKNAERNNSPYGMIMTSTPGMMTSDEGREAFIVKENSTPFSERWYDLSYKEIRDIINTNTKSNFVYIKFTYQQLGYSEEWFKSIVINAQAKWEDIRREILLEWNNSTENSPFKSEDLDIIKGLLKQPINTVLLFNKYELRVYEKLNTKYPALVGVDVSGGYQRDSSAITIVDSYTTRVTAELNSNFISTPELAAVIYKIVSEWIPNSVVNIERNGGFGASVISRLLQTSIRRNLFYTIKDKVIEERVFGSAIHKKTQKTKIYGSDSTKDERENLIEILRDRVEYHKDKIISPIIYEELCGLEVKKTGKIEHSSNTHDDQVFSWLWALYIYYYGGDLMQNWGITKRVLKTDADLEEAVYDLETEKDQVYNKLNYDDNEDIQSQLDSIEQAPGKKMYEDWIKEEIAKDEECLERIINNNSIKKSLSPKYAAMQNDDSSTIEKIPDNVFMNFNKDDYELDNYSVLTGNLAGMWNNNMTDR